MGTIGNNDPKSFEEMEEVKSSEQAETVTEKTETVVEKTEATE
jgi:hypothetical protein